MTYEHYYSSWHHRQVLTETQRAEDLAEARRRANANLMAVRAKGARCITHHAWQ